MYDLGQIKPFSTEEYEADYRKFGTDGRPPIWMLYPPRSRRHHPLFPPILVPVWLIKAIPFLLVIGVIAFLYGLPHL